MGTKVRVLFWTVFDDVHFVGNRYEDPAVVEPVVEPVVDNNVVKESNSVLLHIGMQPGGEMTREEFEAGTVSYDVMYSGVVKKTKTGEEKQLSDADFNTVKNYANGVISGKNKVTEDNGCDLPSYTVIAYEEDGTPYTLETNWSGWIDDADEMIWLLKQYF